LYNGILIINNRKVSKTNNTIQAFWVSMGSLSSMALSIISAMILSRHLDKTDYGTYKQIVYVYSTLLVIFSAGLPRVFSYFLPRYNLNEGKTIVNKINKVLLLAGGVFSIFLFVFSDLIANFLKNEELSYALKVFSPIPLFLLPTLGIEGIFATYKKTQYIAIYNTCSRLIMLLLIITPVLFFKGGYISAIYGWLVASIITFFLSYFFKGIPFKGIMSTKTTLQLKTIFNYSLPLVLASLWGVAIKAADQFYISRFFGTEVFAEFSNGFIELPFVAMITSSTSIVLMPYFSKTLNENGSIEELLVKWRSALNKSALIIYPIVIFFIAFASSFVTLMYSEKYEESTIYFKINMLLNFFNIVIFAPLFFSLGKTKLYANVHMVLFVVIWVTDYLVILLFNSPIAVAFNSTFIHIFKVLIFIYLAANILNVKFYDLFPLKKIGLILIHTVVVILFTLLIVKNIIIIEKIWIELLVSSIIYATLLLVTAPLFKIDYISVINPILHKFKKRNI